MSTFTIMAHGHAQELRVRGVEIPSADCEEILRRVVDRAVAVASDKLEAIRQEADVKPTPLLR
jgi:hypothetical protein